jgi:8-oxo-dGTP diphosphatase
MSRGIRCQVWLTEGDHLVLGEDQARLLELIHECGSIAGAAEKAGISFRYAWAQIKKIEKDAGFALVDSRRGGSGRGSTSLTPQGMELLQEFKNKQRRVDEQLVHLFKNPTLTTDGIVLVDRKIVLIKRGKEPGVGKYALPGGFVEYGETLEDCVVREIREETGLETEVLDLIGTYSDPGRDPRGHIISVVFHLRARGGQMRAGDDADGVSLHDLSNLPELAFDHRKIIMDFLASAAKRKN